MSRYLGILSDKAQIALDKTGIGAHLPLSHTQQTQQPISPNDQHGYISDDAPDGRASRYPAIENLTHSLKALHARYTEPSPPELRQLQIRITNTKGIVLDLDAVARDAKASSKDYYLWGQEQDEDIKDVSDRMAYLKYVTGSVVARFADQIEASRAPLKALRTAEQALAPRRAQRKQLQAQIQAHRTTGKPNTEELEEQLAKQIRDDEPLERDAAAERHKAMLESERIRLQAMREQGEKFILLAQAAEEILSQLSLTTPTETNPYVGHKVTANTRNAVQVTLDTWKPGMTTLPSLAPQHLTHNDSHSFGETHAAELSRVNSFTSTSKANKDGIMSSPEHTGLGPKHGDVPHSATSGPIANESHIEIPISTATNNRFQPESDRQSSLPTSYPTLHGPGTVALTPAATEIGVSGPTSTTQQVPEATVESPLTRDDTVKSTASAAPAYHAIGRDPQIEPVAGGDIRQTSASGGGILGGSDGRGDYRGAEEDKMRLEREERERISRSAGTQRVGDDMKGGDVI